MRAFVVGITLTWLGALSSIALAQDRAAPITVAIEELSGRNSAAARQLLRAGLERRGYTMVEGADADVHIRGSAAARGSRWTVALTLHDRSGQSHGEVSMRRVRGARGMNRLIARLTTAIEAMPGAGARAASADAPQDDLPLSGRASAAEAASPAATEANPTERDAPPDAQPGSSAEPRDDDPPIQIRLEIGAGVRSRAVELLSPDGVDAAYHADAYFELAARAEVRLFDVLFARAWFGSSVALESEREDPALAPVSTQFHRLFGDLGASYFIGGRVAIGAAVGLGWDRYEIAFNELIPTTEYVTVRPAVVSSFRLVGTSLVLDAELGIRVPVLPLGDLESLYGADHKVLGFDGIARFSGTVPPGFRWAIEAGFRHYDVRFRRPGQDVEGTDSGWHATAFAGWQFF